MNSLAASQADLRKFLQAGNIRYLIIGINLLLVIWIAAEAAELTWGVLQPEPAATPAVVASRPSAAAADPGRRLVASLPEWHLMGEATSTAAVKSEVPAEAPDTRLRLTLKGALAAEDPAAAHAIIADDKGDEQRYSIGDQLPGNAELSEIYADRVILERGGRYETLRLPELGGGQLGQSTALAGTPGARMRGGVQERLARVRDDLSKNPENMLSIVQARVHRDPQGNLVGYRLSPGAERDLFDAAGLQEGDIAVRLNDLDLSDPVSSNKAVKLLTGDESVNVVIIRDGVEQSITLGGP